LEWKSALVAFAVVFFAELGDKTQLSTMTIAAKSASPWMVFLGSATALVLSSLLGVVFGEVITKVISPRMLNFWAGLMFIGIGAWMLFGRQS
jgi:putative Ca2+/H+ antiporter (TMEM165/GDT1 family)